MGLQHRPGLEHKNVTSFMARTWEYRIFQDLNIGMWHLSWFEHENVASFSFANCSIFPLLVMGMLRFLGFGQ